MLIIEVVAVRVLSPYYGNTMFTVSSVISVILAALSIGYYAGGKLADRRPSLALFFGIILVSGIFVIIFHFLSILLLPVLSYFLSIIIGPLVSSLALFFLPALLLGTLSPYAVKLQSMRMPHQGVGSVAGNIFFWSTVGSIMGSLLAGFVLIPQLGIDTIFIGTGIVLFTLGCIPLIVRGAKMMRLFQALFLIIFLTYMTTVTAGEAHTDHLYHKDGTYSQLVIFDGSYNGRPTRFFRQDRSSAGAMFLDAKGPTDLTYEYTKYYSLYKLFTPNAKHILVIGGGAYSIPKAFLADLPQAEVDVSEIEPSLYDLSKKYFALEDNPRLHNIIEDGRRMLQEDPKKYDVMFSDVYSSLYSIPAHFTTQEFFTLVKERLDDDGIFIANVIGDLSKDEYSLVMTKIKTFRSVFPNSYVFATRSVHDLTAQNLIFVGYNSDKTLDFNASSVVSNKDPIISSLKNRQVNIEALDLSLYPILTDNFAPVEFLTAKVLERTFGK